MIARSTLAACVLVALGCGVGGGCREQPAAATANAEPTRVRLAAVETRPTDRYVEITGTLFGEEEVAVAAEVPGRVIEIRADLGDAVSHGGELARLDPTDYQLAVDEQRAAMLASLAKVGLDSLPEGDIDLSTLPVVARAEAQESNAAAKLDRARKLYERTPPLISEQDFADIRTQHEVASTSAGVERLNARSLAADARVRASALRTAERRLALTRLLAPAARPVTYRVALRRVSAGEVVAQGQTLFRLVASDRVKFRGQVPERFASRFAAGTPAQVIVDGYPAPFEAAVSRVAPAVDIATRSFEVEIGAANDDGRLKPGSFVRARIRVGTQPDARFVPDSAVSRFAGVQRVYSVKDGKAVEHRVETGEAVGGQRELLTALAGVDAVIDAPRALRAGAPVTVER